MKSLNFLVLFAFILMGCSDNAFQTVNTENSFSATPTFNAKVDVLWVIDNSHDPMILHQNRIAAKMQSFYDGLVKNNADFRIAATTMDVSRRGEKGELVGAVPVVTKNTTNAVARLQDLLKRGGGGADAEVGLGAMQLALEKEVAKGAQAQFLRKDAFLVIVFLTDDEDFSRGEVSDYKNFLDNIKGPNTAETQNWTANYIGVTDLNDPRCRTFGDYSTRGDEYIELAALSGGVIESICETDFGSYIDQVNIRLKSVLNRFVLAENALLDSLTVYKNGVLIREDSLNGWTYEAETNTVVLNGSARPGPNDEIEIKYEIKNN